MTGKHIYLSVLIFMNKYLHGIHITLGYFDVGHNWVSSLGWSAPNSCHNDRSTRSSQLLQFNIFKSATTPPRSVCYKLNNILRHTRA